MHNPRRNRWTGTFVAVGALGVVALVAPAGSVGAATDDTYQVRNLVSDVPGLAQVTDPHLVNPWGVSFSGTSPLWVSDNEKDVATLYAGGVDGGTQTINPLVVNIPGGAPTGQVSNPTTSFVVHASDGSSAPARFLFVGESGHLSGWAPNVPPPPPSTQAQDAVVTPGAVDKGMAMGQTEAGPMLYVADFSAGTVDAYNGLFQRVITAGNFQDRRLPDGFAPFNVAVLGGKVYVAYAKQDADREDEVAGPGRGFVDVYSTSGHLLRRLVRRGQLNAPWGLAQAPASGFGRFSGDLLVGNFGDGRINAYDPRTGAFRGRLRHEDGSPIQIEGLWALRFGNGVTGDPTTLLFTAGIDDEAHGLFGAIQAAS